MEISRLDEELNKWYKANCEDGHLAWSNLANKSGVSASNIRKIATGEVAKPRFDTARKICEALYPHNSDAVSVFLKEHYPKQAQTWFIGNPKRSELPKDKYNLTRDAEAYLLFKRAMTGMVKVTDLTDVHGKDVVEQKLKVLSEAKLAEVNSEGYLVRCKGAEFTNNSDIHSLVDELRLCATFAETKIAADAAGIKEIDREANRLDHMHFGLNEHGSNMIDAELKAFKEKVYKIYSNPENQGGIPRFLHILVGRFDNK